MQRVEMRHNGFSLHQEALNGDEQAALAAEVFAAARAAPFYTPLTPGGRAMSVQQTSLGDLGWTTDASGYRYAAVHPVTGRPWPPMPAILLELWRRYAGSSVPPDSCLVNFYRGSARMGLHKDADEADQSVPVLGVSLGDTAVFRLGGAARAAASTTVRLRSGDVNILCGDARNAYHGVDRILEGSSRLIPGGGRLNLTLRRAAPVSSSATTAEPSGF